MSARTCVGGPGVSCDCFGGPVSCGCVVVRIFERSGLRRDAKLELLKDCTFYEEPGTRTFPSYPPRRARQNSIASPSVASDRSRMTSCSPRRARQNSKTFLPPSPNFSHARPILPPSPNARLLPSRRSRSTPPEQALPPFLHKSVSPPSPAAL